MNLTRSRCPLVIALLSITIAARTSASTEPAFDQRAPPFWQFVLREFVFKTLASLRHRDDDDLYRKLLEAPFYGGRLAAAAPGDVDAVVSRGNVYSTPDGRWILCQDGCTRCEPCEWRRDDPAVTWTLRRVRRWMDLSSSKWDLRLSIVSKMDEGRSRGRYKRVYATSRDREADKQTAHDSVPATSKQNYAFEKAQQTNFETPIGTERYSNSDQPNVDIGTGHGVYRRATGRVKRYRSRRRPASDSYKPDGDVRGVGSSVELPEDDLNPRLIVGIDQNGKKHLVHLVPVDSSLSALDEPINYAMSYRPTYKRQNVARVSRKIQERNTSLYEKLMARIVDSLTTHRNFVEKFLYSDRLESETHSESPVLSPYSTYPVSEGEDYDGKYVDGYRIDDSGHVNQYPSGVEYQMVEEEEEEEGEELRRYPDLTQKVNKPYGEHQDQNTMIEYEPYGVSAEGQEQQRQQHQNERFLTLADVERKRRNSFAKLMDPTVGHQALSQNHTQTDASDTEFPMKRDFLENSANQALANTQPKINVTDTLMMR